MSTISVFKTLCSMVLLYLSDQCQPVNHWLQSSNTVLMLNKTRLGGETRNMSETRQESHCDWRMHICMTEAVALSDFLFLGAMNKFSYLVITYLGIFHTVCSRPMHSCMYLNEEMSWRSDMAAEAAAATNEAPWRGVKSILLVLFIFAHTHKHRGA